MEQRKVLLIILSVTIILAAVIGVGIWLFYPRTATAPDQVASTSGSLEWEPLDYLQGDGSLPGIEPTQTPDQNQGDFVVTYGVAEDTTSGTQPTTPFVSEQPAGLEPAQTVQPASTPPKSVSAPVSTSQPSPASSAQNASRSTPSTTPRTTVSPAATATVASASSAPAARASNDLADKAYWVQVVSSPNRDTVEQAQQTLKEHQLGSRILTKEIGDTTYFRLRLGPFAARSEAEKFLGWVAQIDGFGDSMIFVDYTTAVLAARTE